MCALKSGMHVAVMGGRGGTIHAWTVCVCLRGEGKGLTSC